MIEWFEELNPIGQALAGTIFTWLMTALGAAGVFLLGIPFSKLEMAD